MSTPTAIAKHSPRNDEALMARQLTDQYQRAIGGLVEVVKFGAMMLTLRQHLSSDHRGPDIKGEGVKGWLQANCPEVSIPTAWRFMAIAEGIRNEMQLGVKVDLALLLSTPYDDLKPKLRKKRIAIEEFLAGKSQRQLLFHFAVPDPKKRGGAREPSEDTRTPEEQRAEFLDLIRTNLTACARHVILFVCEEQQWKELSRDEMLGLQGALEQGVDKIKEHVRSLHK